MTDHKNEEPVAASEALTDEQLEEVAGASPSPAPSVPVPDADLLKPYPPWPG